MSQGPVMKFVIVKKYNNLHRLLIPGLFMKPHGLFMKCVLVLDHVQ